MSGICNNNEIIVEYTGGFTEEQIINEYWANKKVSNINTNQSLPLIE